MKLKISLLFFSVLIPLTGCNNLGYSTQTDNSPEFYNTMTLIDTTVSEFQFTDLTMSTDEDIAKISVDSTCEEALIFEASTFNNSDIIINGCAISKYCEELTIASRDSYEAYIFSDKTEYIYINDFFNEKLTDEDLTKISELKNLKKLSISAQNLNDLDFLEQSTELIVLDIRDNNINDLSALHELNELKLLDISYNPISELGFLEFLPNLKTLDISNTNINDLTGIDKYINLTTLSISGNNINNFKPLESLTNIEALNVSDTNTDNIDFISDMNKLKILFATMDNVLDISALNNKVNIETLYLNFNYINNASYLYNIRDPIEINFINDLSVLEYFKELYPNCNFTRPSFLGGFCTVIWEIASSL